jgi:hypothetical protein
MNALATVCIWAALGGLGAGLVFHLKLSPYFRGRVERSCLKFGSSGALFLVAPWAIMSDKPAAFPVLVTLGLIVGIPLVAGLVLRAFKNRAADV